MRAQRIKITYPDGTSAEDIALFVDSSFGGFGTLHRSEHPQVFYLTDFRVPYDLVIGQLDAFQRDGVLAWEKA
jgi:hypothetical protein